MEERRSKPWVCPRCQREIGRVMFRELYIDAAISVNTDGPNLVCKCPDCSSYKTWYATDRLGAIINEIAENIARRISN